MAVNENTHYGTVDIIKPWNNYQCVYISVVFINIFSVPSVVGFVKYIFDKCIRVIQKLYWEKTTSIRIENEFGSDIPDDRNRSILIALAKKRGTNECELH